MTQIGFMLISYYSFRGSLGLSTF